MALENEQVFGEIIGTPIVDDCSVLIGVDHDKHPCFLVRSNDDDSESAMSSGKIRVDFRGKYSLHEQGITAKRFVKIGLQSRNHDLVPIFCRVVTEVLDFESCTPSQKVIKSKIQVLFKIFKALESNINDYVGLWGEVFYIYRSNNVSDAVRAWHKRKSANIDFMFNDYSLELKTTRLTKRVHHFSLTQVEGVHKSIQRVLSLMLNENDNGFTLFELVEKVLERLGNSSLKEEFLVKFYEAGGKTIAEQDDAFDIEVAENSAKLMNASDIPKPIINSNDEILSVKYKVDLTKTTAVELGANCFDLNT